MVALLNINSLQIKGYVIHMVIGVGALAVGHWLLLGPLEARKTRCQLLAHESDDNSQLRLDPVKETALRVTTRPYLCYKGAEIGLLRDSVSFAAAVLSGLALRKLSANGSTAVDVSAHVVGAALGTFVANGLAVRRLHKLADASVFQFAEQTKETVNSGPVSLFTGAAVGAAHAAVTCVVAVGVSALVERLVVPDTVLTQRVCFSIGLGSALFLLNPVEVSVKRRRLGVLNDRVHWTEYNGAHWSFGEAAATVIGTHLVVASLQRILL